MLLADPRIQRPFFEPRVASATQVMAAIDPLVTIGVLLLCAAPAARAQDSNAIGNPQLRDFQLRPQQQQPPPQRMERQQGPPPSAQPQTNAHPPGGNDKGGGKGKGRHP